MTENVPIPDDREQPADAPAAPTPEPVCEWTGDVADYLAALRRRRAAARRLPPLGCGRRDPWESE